MMKNVAVELCLAVLVGSVLGCIYPPETSHTDSLESTSPKIQLRISAVNDCPNPSEFDCWELCLYDPVTGVDHPTSLSCCVPNDLTTGDIVTDPVALEACMANIRDN